MRRLLAALVALLTPLSSCSPAKAPVSPDAEAEVRRVLEDFHDAAAKADEARYFGHFATGGVFLGTDATERWDVSAFRAYAHPHFAKGKAWTMRATVRFVVVRGDVAWFDEALETEKLGPARGSGVLIRENGVFRIAQYNLAVTVPNERFAAVRALLAAPPDKTGP